MSGTSESPSDVLSVSLGHSNRRQRGIRRGQRQRVREVGGRRARPSSTSQSPASCADPSVVPHFNLTRRVKTQPVFPNTGEPDSKEI